VYVGKTKAKLSWRLTQHRSAARIGVTTELYDFHVGRRREDKGKRSQDGSTDDGNVWTFNWQD